MNKQTRRRGRPKNFDSKPAQTTIQSLDRALDVLNAIASEDGLSLTDICERLDQSPSTVYRILSTLQAREIVEIEMNNQSWHIGQMAYRLGSAFLRRSNLVERSSQAMRDLMETTGETSNLGIETRNKVMFISQIETYESIRAFFPPGTSTPLHASGIGKALLSQFNEDRLKKFFREVQLTQFTDKTIVSADALKEDLKEAKDRGWALDDEEKTIGMRCIAAPIFNIYNDVVAGISVSGPSSRMSQDRIEDYGKLVSAAAEKVSRGLDEPLLLGQA